MTRATRIGSIAVALIAAAVAVTVPAAAAPTTFNVNTTADLLDANVGNGKCAASNGKCSLRAAIQEASADADRDTIKLPVGTFLITRANPGDEFLDEKGKTGDFDILASVKIQGQGSNETEVDAQGLDRVFDIEETGLNVSFTGLEITMGRMPEGGATNHGGGISSRSNLKVVDVDVNDNDVTTGFGGGIAVRGAKLTVINSVIRRNGAESAGGISAEGTTVIKRSSIIDNIGINTGGVEACGDLTLTQSFVGRNSASGDTPGGGIATVCPEFDMTLTNVTVSQNFSEGGAAGIFHGGDTAQLRHVTVANNESTANGAGIRNDSTMTILASIVAGNSPDNCTLFGTTITGYDIDDTDDCGFTETTDQELTDPLLGPPEDNGGPTRTQAISGGSPAREEVPAEECAKTDQRGELRSTPCDIGAFEWRGLPDSDEDV